MKPTKYKGFDYVLGCERLLTLSQWRSLAIEYKSTSRRVEHGETSFRNANGMLLFEVYANV